MTSGEIKNDRLTTFVAAVACIGPLTLGAFGMIELIDDNELHKSVAELPADPCFVSEDDLQTVAQSQPN